MNSRLIPLVLIVLTPGCTDAPVPTELDDDLLTTAAARVAAADGNVVDAANAVLESRDSEYRVAYAEYITHPSSGELGQVIFASDRGNKQLDLQFLPDDPRRSGFDGDPNTIEFLVDVGEGATTSGLSSVETTNAIARGMNTWDAETCSDLGVSVLPIVGFDLGLVQDALGFGGGAAGSDIMHAGWLPPAFFDLVRPDGGSAILGITFTLTFVQGDLDGNGEPDLGAREIYYNDGFSWADDGVSHVDVETVALHEAGHGLSQAHFGRIFGTLSNGKIHFAPRAVMNAGYSGVQRSLTGTDEGGHCSLWGSWPN